ncbi:chloramphenicol-sensitive protein RarD [Aliiruegeria lutimaris]|uniref:Chloramphenicol-sensitive protein RarD n=2 Tax=Aliiruegeria lutimaris TaxID=571298 RepID=A0A1G9EVF8_9RHOB|nr:chloramphenicol-sensitive protein RarD [Aliiruegeria lutimaris]
MIGACTIWGLSPLFYKLLAHVPPLEVLSYRTLWPLGLFGAILAIQGQLGRLRAFLGRRWPIVALAAIMISINWGFYIWSIQVERAMEASLGYYTFPLVAVLMGVVVFGERLALLQWLAVGMATAGVLVLTFGLGLVPVVALILAVTFGFYGLIKKRLQSGAMISVTAEVLLLSPLATGWLIWLASSGSGGPQATGWETQLLLALSGPMTAGPLILFSYATHRVNLATVGLLQYLNPTLQFLCAALVFGEPFTRWHGLTFALIWAALALYSAQALRADRAARRRAINASRSETV